MRVNYSIKNCITFIVNYIITLIFLFISHTIFIKTLGIDYAGLSNIFSNVLLILNLLEFGFGSAITYSLYKYIKKDDKNTIKAIMKYHEKIYHILALITLGVGLLIIPILKFIIIDLNVDINIYIIYMIFLLTNVSTYLCSYKRNLIFSYQRNYVINIIHIIAIVILNISQILVIYFTRNYYLYLVINLLVVILENIAISLKVNKDYPFIKDKDVPSLNNKVKKSIDDHVKALFMHKVSGAVSDGADSILISIFFGVKVVGLYSSYYYIIHAVHNLFSNIIKSTSASVGNLLVDNNYDKNYKTFKNIKFLNLWIAVFTSICLLFITKPFITIWLGNDYLLSDFVLLSLVLTYFQRSMRNTYIVFKDSAGIWIEDRYITMFKPIINIVSSIILLKYIGLAGVFLGTFTSDLLLWLYVYPKYVYKKLFNRDYYSYFKEMFISVVIFVFTTLIVYLFSSILTIESVVISLLVNSLICLVIPNILMIIIYKNTDEFKYYINLIKNILTKGKNRHES